MNKSICSQLLESMGLSAFVPEAVRALELLRSMHSQATKTEDYEAPARRSGRSHGNLSVRIAHCAGQRPRPPNTRALTDEPNGETLLSVCACVRFSHEVDCLIEDGVPPGLVVAVLRSRGRDRDVFLTRLLEELWQLDLHEPEVCETKADALQPGDLVAHHVRTRTGTLLLPRGSDLTEKQIDTLRKLPTGSLKEPLLILRMPA